MDRGAHSRKAEQEKRILVLVCQGEHMPVLVSRCRAASADPRDTWDICSFPIDSPSHLSVFRVASAILVDGADLALGVAECTRLLALAVPTALVTAAEVSPRARERAGIQMVLLPSFGNCEIEQLLLLAARVGQPESQVQRVAEVSIALHPRVHLNRARRTVIVDGCEAGLTSQKFALLCYLVDRAGVAVGASELVKHGLLRPTQAQRFKGLVQELRGRLGPARDLIQPVPGYGYRFDF